MDKTIKTKWLEALESGKYHKGRNQLRCGNRFCCLGVLCDIIDASSWKKYGGGEYFYKDVKVSLPTNLRTKLGITINEQTDLISINDGCGGYTKVIEYIKEKM